MRAPDDVAQRLWACEPRLRLLFAHLAGRKLRERIEADDLVQETFLRALGSAASLPPESAGESELWRYLVHLARHVAVDASRALRARKRAGGEQRLARSDWSTAGPHESQLAARTRGPASRAAEAESLERLAAAYASLAPEHRRVIGLRQFEDLTAAQAAARMGRSEVAVHSLYRRALEAWESAANPPASRARGGHGP
jgi:RNA polymerase sigma factor (sigma-70 family)